MTIASDAIVSAIRGVILGELGEVRTVPAGAWIEGQPAQFGVHGGLDADTTRRLRASGQRLFDFELAPPRRTGAVGSSAAAQAIHSLEVRIVLWLPITLVADTASTAHRRSVRAEMMEQARVITDALEWPGNLTRDPEGTDTSLVSGMLREAAAPRIVREDWSAGLYEIELRMTGLVHETREIIPAPIFTNAPAIYVADGTDPEVGATLIADPGTVTGAHTERGQWMRDGAPIGETGVTYVLVEADEGASITYRATAIGSGGTVASDSNAIVPGEAAAPLIDTDRTVRRMAGGTWPSVLASGRFALDWTPDASSSPAPAPGTFAGLAGTSNGASDYLRIRYTGAAWNLEHSRTTGGASGGILGVTFSAGVTYTIVVDHATGVVSCAALGGTPQAASAGSWNPANDLSIGSTSGTPSAPARGTVSDPYVPA